MSLVVDANAPELYRLIPEHVWEPARDPDGTPREEADVAELTGQLADLEVRQRRRDRCGDRFHAATDMGLRNLPLHSFAQNRIWCQIVALASEFSTWMGLLAHAEKPARRWELKCLRHRLFQVPATFARHARQHTVHLSDRSTWAAIV